MVTESTSNSKWSLLEKMAFRFVFLYFMLFIIFENNGAYPFWYYLMEKPNQWLQQFVPWFAKNVLYLSNEITVFTNGSGDTTYDYLIVLLVFIVSIFGAIIWSLVDRHRENYTRLYYWLWVAVRFYVGLMLVNYGLFKIIKLQFPYPSFSRLIQPYGESSPMGIAWTFLGFSKGYNLFMGIAELMAGLLLFRRTVTIGAFLTLMTARNVTAVNYFYDVPVKILSTHLVLMTIFLLAPSFKTLITFFFTYKAVSLKPITQPSFKKKWIKVSLIVFKSLVIAYAIGYSTFELFGYEKEFGEKAPKPALYGLFKVTHFEKNSDSIPSDINNSERWRYIILENVGNAEIQTMNKTRLFYKSEIDTLKKELKLTSYQDSLDAFTIKYTKTDKKFTFETINKNDTIKASGRILLKENFNLTNRGFNWINEYPFNR